MTTNSPSDNESPSRNRDDLVSRPSGTEVSADSGAGAEKGLRIELLDPAVVEILRRKTPAERIRMIFAANRTMRLRLEGHLRTLHPDWDRETLLREIARRMTRGAG